MLKLTLGYLDEDSLNDTSLGSKAAVAVFFFSAANIHLVQRFRANMATLYPKQEPALHASSTRAAPGISINTSRSLEGNHWTVLQVSAVTNQC